MGKQTIHNEGQDVHVVMRVRSDPYAVVGDREMIWTVFMFQKIGVKSLFQPVLFGPGVHQASG